MGKPSGIYTQDNGAVVIARGEYARLPRQTRCAHLPTETQRGCTIYNNGVHDVCHACLLQGTPFANIDEYWRNIARRHAERWG